MNEKHAIFFLLVLIFAFNGCSNRHNRNPVSPGNEEPEIGDMVLVSAGEFRMGSMAGEFEEDEDPIHTVSLDAYYISSYEVTNSEYADFLNDMENPGGFWDWKMEIVRSGSKYRAEIGREDFIILDDLIDFL